MITRCEAELIFERLEGLLRKVFYEEDLSNLEKSAVNKLIDRYWKIECPADNPCRANTCSFSKPVEWLESCGYISLGDYLDRMKKGVKVKYFDVFRAEWARQKGHYNG